MKYLLIDTANLFARARHSTPGGADTWQKIGLALHIMLNSVMKVHRLYKPDHVIFALESRSWRKDHTGTYKANRAVTKAKMTVRELEEDKEFWEVYEQFTNWLNERTNCTVIKVAAAEADDIIARWTALHPNDEHIILSNDTDFYQLLSENVTIYNGMTNNFITTTGFFDDKGKPVVDKKTNEHKTVGDPKFVLFEKCMRGDPTDHIMSAYPGVRTKGSTKKVGLIEAYADREKRGWAWNNMMLQRWVDHNGVEHRVLDRYEENRVLVDLTAQPSEIRDAIDAALVAVTPKSNSQIGTHLIKFCSKYELNKMLENVNHLAEVLSLSLPKETINE
jgi:5'-3' exonuclease